MALTPEQLIDFRADIGDNNVPPAFSDPELQRLYVRADTNYHKAVLLAFDQLISSAAKFSEYTQNASTEKKQQIFENLRKARADWQANHVQQGNQVRIVGMRSVPPRDKDVPYTENGDPNDPRAQRRRW
jgi:hypothetical protein